MIDLGDENQYAHLNGEAPAPPATPRPEPPLSDGWDFDRDKARLDVDFVPNDDPPLGDLDAETFQKMLNDANPAPPAQPARNENAYTLADLKSLRQLDVNKVWAAPYRPGYRGFGLAFDEVRSGLTNTLDGVLKAFQSLGIIAPEPEPILPSPLGLYQQDSSRWAELMQPNTTFSFSASTDTLVPAIQQLLFGQGVPPVPRPGNELRIRCYTWLRGDEFDPGQYPENMCDEYATFAKVSTETMREARRKTPADRILSILPQELWYPTLNLRGRTQLHLQPSTMYLHPSRCYLKQYTLPPFLQRKQDDDDTERPTPEPANLPVLWGDPRRERRTPLPPAWRGQTG